MKVYPEPKFKLRKRGFDSKPYPDYQPGHELMPQVTFDYLNQRQAAKPLKF